MSLELPTAEPASVTSQTLPCAPPPDTQLADVPALAGSTVVAGSLPVAVVAGPDRATGATTVVAESPDPATDATEGLPPAAAEPDPAAPVAAPAFVGLWWSEAQSVTEDRPSWLWHGYLAPGCVTVLTGPAKAGKTTLLAALLARMGAGGTLAGLAVRPGKAAVVSEEPLRHWQERGQRLGFGPHLCLFCQPFQGLPRPAEWLALINHLLDLHGGRGLDLVVFDSLSVFLPPWSEASSTGILQALLPLKRLTAAGISVGLWHHPAKGEPAIGQAARGSGALLAQPDVLIELRWHVRPDSNDRRRRLHALSRFPDTPRQLVIELTADGTDYTSHGDLEMVDFMTSWDALRDVLGTVCYKLTRPEVLERWPADWPKPATQTLWRWLDRAVALNLVRRDGAGVRFAPFRYWLPEREKYIFQQPPLWPSAPPPEQNPQA
jgi:hypothetical protein